MAMLHLILYPSQWICKAPDLLEDQITVKIYKVETDEKKKKKHKDKLKTHVHISNTSASHTPRTDAVHTDAWGVHTADTKWWA